MLLTAIVATACKIEEDEQIFHIDPNSKVFVKQADLNVKSATAEGHLSAMEIVKKANFIAYYNTGFSDSPIYATWPGKDTISSEPALLRFAADIIYDRTGYGDYGLQHEFIDGYDFVICSGTSWKELDTLAYIPNANMTAAKQAINEALLAQDTAAVYEIFKNAFKFVPITGSEYRILIQNGLN